jgi:hypothetical protein
MVAEDIANWLLRVAGVILAIALIALVREAPGLLSPTLRTWTFIAAGALALVPLLATTERLPPEAVDLVQAVIAVVLVPVWAIWLARSVDGARAQAAAASG